MRSCLSLFSFLSLFFATIFLTSCDKDAPIADDSQKLSFRDPQSFTYSLDSAGVGDSVVITFDVGNGADCGHVQIQVSGPDGSGWVGGQPVAPDSGLATLVFIPQEPGEYAVRAKYTRTGNPKDCDFESTKWLESPDLILVGGDDEEGDTTSNDSTLVDSCESAFLGEVITCDSGSREVVFTYVAGEDVDHLKIQGGLTNGVDGDVEVTVAGADLDVTQKTPGHSTNRVITLTGSAVACDTITITVIWTSTNQGNTITGDWSADDGDEEYTVEALECE